MITEQVILQPCNNRVSREHYLNTVENSIALNEIRDCISEEDYKQLSSIYPDGNVRLWGIINGKNNVNYHKWLNIQNGDTVLFYWDQYFQSRANVKFCLKNRILAAKIWQTDQNNQTWENIYFIGNPEECKISKTEINKLCNYKTDARPQGFRILNAVKSLAVLEYYDFPIDEDVLKEQLDSEDIHFAEKIDAALSSLRSTNAQSPSNHRTEQAILERWLFKNKETAVCGICGKTYPVKLMEAAHIKRRDKSTEEERLNKQIVMPMCNFGCNDLYERDYIKVENGIITANEHKKPTSDTKLYLDQIVGRSCSYYNDETKVFFDYHNDNAK